jgi:hypothetical protein
MNAMKFWRGNTVSWWDRLSVRVQLLRSASDQIRSPTRAGVLKSRFWLPELTQMAVPAICRRDVGRWVPDQSGQEKLPFLRTGAAQFQLSVRHALNKIIPSHGPNRVTSRLRTCSCQFRWGLYFRADAGPPKIGPYFWSRSPPDVPGLRLEIHVHFVIRTNLCSHPVIGASTLSANLSLSTFN